MRVVPMLENIETISETGLPDVQFELDVVPEASEKNVVEFEAICCMVLHAEMFGESVLQLPVALVEDPYAIA